MPGDTLITCTEFSFNEADVITMGSAQGSALITGQYSLHSQPMYAGQDMFSLLDIGGDYFPRHS